VSNNGNTDPHSTHTHTLTFKFTVMSSSSYPNRNHWRLKLNFRKFYYIKWFCDQIYSQFPNYILSNWIENALRKKNKKKEKTTNDDTTEGKVAASSIAGTDKWEESKCGWLRLYLWVTLLGKSSNCDFPIQCDTHIYTYTHRMSVIFCYHVILMLLMLRLVRVNGVCNAKRKYLELIQL
jgi:hypothetical protein